MDRALGVKCTNSLPGTLAYDLSLFLEFLFFIFYFRESVGRRAEGERIPTSVQTHLTTLGHDPSQNQELDAQLTKPLRYPQNLSLMLISKYFRVFHFPLSL